jgi:hypothetical protein
MHVTIVFGVVVFQIASQTLMRVFQGVIGGSNILIKVAVSSTHITFYFFLPYLLGVWCISHDVQTAGVFVR